MKLKSIKSKAQSGFTLIELMITVAIVGILAAVALPAYQNYTIRGQVSEGFTLAGGVQTAFAENYAQTGVPAPDMATLGLSADPVGKYVTDVTQAGGKITVTYGGSSNTKIAGGSITLQYKDDGAGNIHWMCQPDGKLVTTAYVPSSCTNS